MFRSEHSFCNPNIYHVCCTVEHVLKQSVPWLEKEEPGKRNIKSERDCVGLINDPNPHTIHTKKR